MKADALSVIEAIYRPIEDDSEWIEQILAELGGLGVGPCGGHLMRDSLPVEDTVHGLPQVGFTRAHILKVWAQFEGEFRALVCRPAPRLDSVGGRMARLAQWLNLSVDEVAGRLGPLPEVTGLLGCGPRGTDGVVIVLPELSSLSPRLRSWLVGIGVHLEHASRLRARLRAHAAKRGPNGSMAIFEPSGRTLYLDGESEPVRPTLVEAVLATERARGALRRLDTDEALATWRGLADGRWSVVEHVESDGKRLLFAFENTPQTLQFGLQEPERLVLSYAALGHPNKYIAYELGWSESVVSRRLREGMRKLGLRNRAELIRLGVPWSSPGPKGAPALGEAARSFPEKDGERPGGAVSGRGAR